MMMDMERKIDKLYEAIYEGADGEPSMKVDIATIKTKIDQSCPVGKANKTLILWLWGAIGGVVILIIRLHL